MVKDEKYDVTGMSCAACSAHVENAVKQLKGVKEVSVNLLTNSMVVSYEEPVTPESIVKAVSDAGYGAKKEGKEEAASSLNEDRFVDKETPKLVKRLVLSLILLIPLFYIGMGYMLSWPLGEFGENPFYVALTEMLLSLSIMLINYKFFVSGAKAIIHKAPNMDTLVMLGSGISWIYSVAMLFVMGNNAMSMNMEGVMRASMNISFETSGMVPALIAIGKTLESYSKGKTTNALKGLFDLAPKEAHLLVEGEEKTVLASSLKEGDVFLTKPGESFPADGIVLKGESAVDESPLTGESLPIDKKEGDKVSTASLNQNGALVCKATHVGEATTLSQIIKMVEEASGTKTKISEVADKVAGVFVPIVLLIALIVTVCWLIFGQDFVAGLEDVTNLSYALERGISILVISCPCALGLATPVAIMVGNGLAARHGILFKNASALEKTGKIDFVVLDKTGTITEGKPKVTDILPYKMSENEFLEKAASIEANSSHPLALAVLAEAKRKGIAIKPVSSFTNMPGNGIKGILDGENYLAGSYSFFLKSGLVDHALQKQVDDLAKDGKTPLLFAKDDCFIGIIAVADTLKEDSSEAIRSLTTLGITPIMLTGDNEVTAKAIAKNAGIEAVVANCLPLDKQKTIKELKQYGTVAMVGDGINDAVALSEADIGIAIGAGSDIAIDSSEVVLMKSSLMDVVKAIRISKVTYRNILENLFWAFFYNLIMIPIAAGAFSALGLAKLRPWMGAAAMSLSSVTVVLNALRLNLFKPEKKEKTHHRLRKELPAFLGTSIQKEGKEENMEIELSIKGMMCEHCVKHVKEALEKVGGVTHAEVSLEKKNAVVSTNGTVSKETLTNAVKEAGYEAQ